MKSSFLTSPKTIEIIDIPIPSVPDDGLLMQVKACGICGSDIRRWKEGSPPGVEGVTAGHEASGIVVEAGKSVSRFVVGDAISVAPDIHCGICYFCRRGLYNLCDNLKLLGITPGYPGALAEYLLLTGEMLQNGIVHKMPKDIDFQSAAFAEPCCSVLSSHNKMGNSLNQVIVVLGSGPIGCLHVVIGKSRGARVIVSEPSTERRGIVQKFKPSHIINPLDEDVVQTVRKLTDGIGADVVVCANPVASTQSQAIEMVRKGGRVALFGGLPKASPLTTLDANRIHYGEITVAGDFSYHPSIHELALELLHNNTIPAHQFITRSYTLNQIGKAFETAASGSDLKVMINFE